MWLGVGLLDFEAVDISSMIDASDALLDLGEESLCKVVDLEESEVLLGMGISVGFREEGGTDACRLAEVV